jgi:hypothetical protein
VLVASANYSLIALIEIFFRALQPVFLSTPVELGGLGLDPPAIGIVMSSFGILDGLFTLTLLSRFVNYFGVKKVYLIGITCAAPAFALFPIISYLARESTERSGKLGMEVWSVVGAQLVLVVLVYLCFSAYIPLC